MRQNQGGQSMFDVWKNVLAEIEQKVSPAAFTTWFKNTQLQSVENGIATVSAPNPFITKQLESDKYNKIILQALKNNNVKVKRAEYVVKSSAKTRKRGREVIKEVVEIGAEKRELLRKVTPKFSTGLNPKYTLDGFVVGSNNDLAVSVAKNVIDKPGEKYNPFFLYGGPGLGKTHLVQAIGNELLQRNSQLKILYIPINHFYTDFINSIRAGKGNEFSAKFMKLDVLIVDDFQMIAKKDQSQVAFFDIFNDLYQANKQIIVTSDRLPSQIETIDERLASRLAWAGAIDLQMPNFEDKCAILKSKAEYQGLEIEDAAIEYLAENVKTNIRDLESEFSHLMAIAEFRNMTPLEVINQGYIQTQSATRLKAVSPRQVAEEVAKFYHLTVKEMCGKSRVAHIKNARQVTMFLLSKELSMSTPKIALEVGVKDHTTVMHGIKKIENDMKLNFVLREQVATIREKIYG